MFDKKDKIGLLAYKKIKGLNKLIKQLKETTIGSLVSDVTSIEAKITQINEEIEEILKIIDNYKDIKTTLNQAIPLPSYNPTTQVITFTNFNGDTLKINLSPNN